MCRNYTLHNNHKLFLISFAVDRRHDNTVAAEFVNKPEDWNTTMQEIFVVRKD